MGYNFAVTNVSATTKYTNVSAAGGVYDSETLAIQVELTNFGVAPFYYPLELRSSSSSFSSSLLPLSMLPTARLGFRGSLRVAKSSFD